MASAATAPVTHIKLKLEGFSGFAGYSRPLDKRVVVSAFRGVGCVEPVVVALE